MKKIGKKIAMLGITLSGIMYSNLAFATVEGVNPYNTFTGNTTSDAVTSVTNVGNNVLGMVSTGASVLAVIILIVLGIKYMMGSAEEKAEYKKTLLPYFIGALFVFGAGLVTNIIFSISTTNWAS